MARRERTFNVIDTPERIWAAVSDFAAWSNYLLGEEPKHHGWGRTLRPLDVPGNGCRLEMLHGAKVVQEWVVQAWEPGRRLALQSTKWYGAEVAAMSSAISIDVAQASAVESRVTITVDAIFTHPIYGLITKIAPVGRALEPFLAHMERGILARLERA